MIMVVFLTVYISAMIYFPCFHVYYPMNLNSFVHCMYVHQGHRTAATGLEAGAPGF